MFCKQNAIDRIIRANPEKKSDDFVDFKSSCKAENKADRLTSRQYQTHLQTNKKNIKKNFVSIKKLSTFAADFERTKRHCPMV